MVDLEPFDCEQVRLAANVEIAEMKGVQVAMVEVKNSKMNKIIYLSFALLP